MAITDVASRIQPTYPSLTGMVEQILAVLKPPERLSVSEAAEKYRYVNQPGAYVGPWFNKTVPYMVEPMDTLTSREFNACVFVGAAQSGKTDALLINWLVHTVVCDPADMIMYQTSGVAASDFTRRRINRLHRHTKPVGDRLMAGTASDTIHYKTYTGGNILSISWPSINELSGRPVGKVALTDLDRMPLSVEGEGAPFDLARKRTTTFGSYAMTLAESSPGFDCGDRDWSPDPERPHLGPPVTGIVSLYNRGDRRRWLWPCPHCHEWFEAEFKYLTWVDSKDLVECAESAVMGCPHCGGVIEPSDKAKVNRLGKWIKEGQRIDKEGVVHGEGLKSDIASFWNKGVAAAFSSWKTLVLNTLKAQEEEQHTGSSEALRTTVNTDRGEVFVPNASDLHRTPEALQARAENLGDEKVPNGVRFLIATVDVQRSHFVIQVHGVGKGMDIYVIDRWNIYKSERFDEDGDRKYLKPGSYIEDWHLLTKQVLEKKYHLADESGRYMQVKAMGYDTGGLNGVTAKAYQYYRDMKKKNQASRIYPLKGNSSATAPRAVIRYPDAKRNDAKATARGDVPVLMLGSNQIKDMVDAMLERTAPFGGMIRFADWLSTNFFKELCAEQRDDKGRWVNPLKHRNEAFDLLAYCVAICVKLGVEKIDWDAPPIWADEWDRNPLVIDPNVGEQVGKTDNNDLQSLAELLS